ncbi:hypothetical protein Tco_1532081 [Tanacetum coccineum]
MLLIEGSEIWLQERERKSKLYDEFDMFTSVPGETIHSYYLRFAQMINNMHSIGMIMRPIQVNTKFINHLQPEWRKFVTDVKLSKDLNNTNFDHLYAYLRQHEAHVDEIVQGRQNQGYAGSGTRSNANATEVNRTGGTNTAGHAKVIRCYNYILSEVPTHDNYPDNHVIDQNVQEMQYSDEHDSNNNPDIDITKMSNQVAKCNEVDKENKIINESLTAELERYKEQIKLFEERQQCDLNDREKYIDGQLRKVIVDKNAKEKEDKYLDEIIELEKQKKALDNVIDKIAQRKVPALYCGNTIVKQHAALSVIDTEETLKLAEESRLKMHAKQNDLIVQEKKVNIAPIDYVALNKMSEHFVKHFVPQNQLSTEQAFWLPISKPVSDIPPVQTEPVLKEIPRELPTISLVKDNFNKMRSHVNDFENVVTFCTKVTGQNEGLMRSGVTTRIPEKLLGDEGLSSGGTKLNSIFITTEGAATRDVGTETHGGLTESVLQTQKTPSPSSAFIKENIDVLRTMIKEHDQQAKMKATPRKLAYADSDKEAPARVYEGNKDPEDHLGIPPVLHISAFMHGHGHPKLAKKLNDKIPKTMDEMFKRVRAFIRGEVATGSAEMVRPSQRDKGKDTFTPLTKTSKEILSMESVSFPEPLPLIRTPEKQNLNKFCDYHRDIGHNTNNYNQLKKKLEEAVASGKLAHLVKDIRRNNQRNVNQGRNGVKVINMIREEGSRKRPFEEGTKEDAEECFTLRARKSRPIRDRWESHVDKNQLQAVYLADILTEYMEVYSHDGSESTTVLRFVMEHQLKMYPFAEPVTHKRRPVAPEGRLALKEKVFRWLREGLIRKVQHLEWITNAIPIKLTNGTWKVHVNYSTLNKACAKDMYPFPEEGEELASLMGYPYKCFLRLPKEYNQIRMAEDDEEKTGHMEEGVYCFTHMLKELKNSAATLQRMMEKILADQRGRNMEIHLEEIVIKSKTISKFISKLTELKHPIREARTRMETTKESSWMNEAEEAL